MLEFYPLCLEQRTLIEEIMQTKEFASCQLAFPSLFDYERFLTEICVWENIVFLRQKEFDKDGCMAFLFPLCKDTKLLPKAFSAIDEFCALKNVKPLYFDITDNMLSSLEEFYGKEKLYFILRPDFFDYIYSRKSLVELPGGKLKTIRQSVASFFREYEGRLEYEAISDRNILEVLEFQSAWYKKYASNKASGLEDENRFIAKCLKNWNELSLVGGIIRIDGKIRSYTFGCELGKNIFDALIEKADFEFNSSLYRAMNNSFAKALLEKWEYVNRENDLGIEGLRTAKKRYQPFMILKKYEVCIK